MKGTSALGAVVAEVGVVGFLCVSRVSVRTDSAFLMQEPGTAILLLKIIAKTNPKDKELTVSELECC